MAQGQRRLEVWWRADVALRSYDPELDIVYWAREMRSLRSQPRGALDSLFTST